jgi:hypothetical protein
VQTIYLELEDDIVSIRDRLERVEERQVVLVFPEQGDFLTEYLDLALLRRHADALHLDLGLVTTDGRVSSHARALGFPTFPSVRSSERSRRRWWRGRRRSERVGYRTELDEADRREVERRKSPQQPWQRWLKRYLAILLYLLTLAVLFVAAVYTVPGATVTFKPNVQPLRVSKQIVADPQLENADFSGASVPGRQLSTTQEWQAEVGATGRVEVPDAPAKGEVVFVNRVEQEVAVPAGTRVRTSAGRNIIFQTIEAVEVPGAEGGTVETEVVAIEPGPEGNVDSNLINRVVGSLALQLEVRNLEPMSGGASREEISILEADKERLRAQVLQQLQALALGEMEGLLAEQEFLAKDSLQVAQILHETYSHFPGEQSDRLALDMRAELQATAVDETQAVGLVYDELATAVRPGFELVPSSLDFSSGSVAGVDNEGRVTFEMIGEGRVAAVLDLEEYLDLVTGQEIGLAMAFLYEQLPLQDYPTTEIWPGWHKRLPFLPARIQTKIETGE